MALTAKSLLILQDARYGVYINPVPGVDFLVLDWDITASVCSSYDTRAEYTTAMGTVSFPSDATQLLAGAVTSQSLPIDVVSWTAQGDFITTFDTWRDCLIILTHI